MNRHELKFYTALSDLFIGAEVDGIGGFIKLMKFKRQYYQSIEKLLKYDIEKALDKQHLFREELFDKLYQFFSLYFTQNGCIYFNHTPFHNQIYDRVYNGKDVALFWKTNMLYYVKSEKLWQSLPINHIGYDFYFDASELEQKVNNTKNGLVYQFKDITKTPEGAKQINFLVKLSSNGNKTKNDDILKELSEQRVNLSDEDITKLFAVFEKQNEVDYFINKDAKAFLTEQFKLWIYQYFWNGSDDWSEARVQQLTILKKIATKIIDFIAQFEDELVKIWNKPKFVRNSNYVITLDKLVDKGLDILILTNHVGIKSQIKEWQDLGIVPEGFVITDISKSSDMFADGKYKYLPFDTKHFDEEVKYTILGLFDNLDEECDGVLIKSDNYQALNTIMPKYKEQVDLIYIDPPFNTGSDFYYNDNYQDSTWCTIMWDRLNLSKAIMSDKGSIYVHLDYRASHYNRMLMDSIFGVNNFRNEIIWAYRTGGNSPSGMLPRKHDTIVLYSKNDLFELKNIKERQYYEKTFMGSNTDEHGRFYTDTNLRDVIDGVVFATEQNSVFEYNARAVLNLSNEFFAFNTQKPEGLMDILFKISQLKKKSVVLDFFSGSGTTITTAQKTGKKWVGVEMGIHIDDTYIVNEDIKKSSLDKVKFDILEILSTKSCAGGEVCNVNARKIGVLGRLKEAINGNGKHEPYGLTNSPDYKHGGMFKYYELEQYEETLANCQYKDYEVFDEQDPYSSYVFMADERLLTTTAKIKDNQVKIDVTKLYPDVDIAESLSNLLGKKIAKLTKTQVTFTDNETIDLTNLELATIKPLIWWG